MLYLDTLYESSLIKLIIIATIYVTYLVQFLVTTYKLFVSCVAFVQL